MRCLLSWFLNTVWAVRSTALATRRRRRLAAAGDRVLIIGRRLGVLAEAAKVIAAAGGRGGRPADIAAAAEYLASPDASYVTGQVIQVNGGALVGR